MAELANDTGSLRFRLEVVDREAPLRGPAPRSAQDGGAPSGRLLASAFLGYLDRRDDEVWPFVHQPVLYLAPESARALAGSLADLLQGNVPGFAWQSGEDAALGVQVGAPEGLPAGAFLVEVGMDLAPFLADAAGAPRRTGAELSLFRFLATRAALVAFAGALKAEIEGQLAA
jgi:hypothetical protein